MKKLVIDESKWYRGKGSVTSALRRRSDGQMCCLGFLCLAAGATAEEITGRPTPQQVATKDDLGYSRPIRGYTPSYADVLGLREESNRILHGKYRPQTIGYTMAITNDCPVIGDEVRKQLLTQDFAQIGWEVEFVPEVVTPANPAPVSGDVG